MTNFFIVCIKCFKSLLQKAFCFFSLFFFWINYFLFAKLFFSCILCYFSCTISSFSFSSAKIKIIKKLIYYSWYLWVYLYLSSSWFSDLVCGRVSFNVEFGGCNVDCFLSTAANFLSTAADSGGAFFSNDEFALLGLPLFFFLI